MGLWTYKTGWPPSLLLPFPLGDWNWETEEFRSGDEQLRKRKTRVSFLTRESLYFAQGNVKVNRYHPPQGAESSSIFLFSRKIEGDYARKNETAAAAFWNTTAYNGWWCQFPDCSLLQLSFAENFFSFWSSIHRSLPDFFEFHALDRLWGNRR